MGSAFRRRGPYGIGFILLDFYSFDGMKWNRRENPGFHKRM